MYNLGSEYLPFWQCNERSEKETKGWWICDEKWRGYRIQYLGLNWKMDMWVKTIDEVDNNIQGNGVTSGWRCSCSSFLRPKTYWSISQAETTLFSWKILEKSGILQCESYLGLEERVLVTLDSGQPFDFVKIWLLATSIIRFPKLAQHLAHVARCTLHLMFPVFC